MKQAIVVIVVLAVASPAAAQLGGLGGVLKKAQERKQQIDDLIINGRCSQAQSLFRQLRSAGCRVSASDHFGTACASP